MGISFLGFWTEACLTAMEFFFKEKIVTDSLFIHSSAAVLDGHMGHLCNFIHLWNGEWETLFPSFCPNFQINPVAHNCFDMSKTKHFTGLWAHLAHLLTFCRKWRQWPPGGQCNFLHKWDIIFSSDPQITFYQKKNYKLKHTFIYNAPFCFYPFRVVVGFLFL